MLVEVEQKVEWYDPTSGRSDPLGNALEQYEFLGRRKARDFLRHLATTGK